MSQSIEEGIKALLDKIVTLGAEFDNVAKNVLNQEANQVLSIAKRTSRVDTGLYRRSWTIESAKKVNDVWEVKIYNTAKSETGEYYAVFLEYGHRIRGTGRWWTGDFTLTNAMANAPERMKQRLESFLRGMT